MAMAQTSSPENYSLGRGRLYFNRKISAGVYDGERDLGNAPDLSLNVKVDWLEHFSSRSGMKSKDKRIASQVTPEVSFMLDEIVAENLAMTFLADVATVTQAAATGEMVSFTAKKSRFFDLGKRNVSNVVVEVGAVVKTVSVDYTVDAATGRIYIPETSTIADAATVDVTFDCAIDNSTQLKTFKQYEVEGIFRFVSDNPTGQNMELMVWNLSLSPDGDTAFIGDKWTEIKFKGEMLRDDVGHADSPYCTVRFGA